MTGRNGRGLREKPMTIIFNIVIFGLAFLMLRLPYRYSLALVAIVVVALLRMERKGAVDALFSLYIRNRRVAAFSALICILAIPVLLSTFRYQSHIAVMALIYAMVCLGLNFQMGSTNMVNFAPAAFMGIGAYSMAVMTVKIGVSPWLGMLTAILTSAFAGLLIGLPTLRTKGYYLSLVTMALQLAFVQLIKNMPSIGGPNGISGVKAFSIGGFSLYKAYTFFGVKLTPHFFYLIFCAFALIILVYVAQRIYISRYGLALNNIAQDEIAANCLGVDVPRCKLFAFVIGGVYCGVGGALYASLTSFVGPNDFTFARSLVFICMVILGGMDNPIGVTVGAFLLTVITEKLRNFSDYAQLIYAVLLVVILIVRPSGLIPKRVRDYCAVFGRELLSPSRPDAGPADKD
ncbi:MAG: branched-chain amino acid ABC transporter permease [Synergistaceae bacterium]|jgi:branched-chain amino acid transport system permease protein|nr:branched-chain amino acid ABC transporter permease [Synergistaceae bacterium]